jgi:CheY-like chemotaxis protein
MTSEPFFLCVEDDPPSREIMGVLLREVMGFSNVTLFEDSFDIVNRVNALPAIPNVILLDIQMQPHDGYEVLKMLHSLPRYQSSIIVAVTASVTISDVKNLQASGFNSLIGKPIRQRFFPELLNRILAGEEVWTLA